MSIFKVVTMTQNKQYTRFFEQEPEPEVEVLNPDTPPATDTNVNLPDEEAVDKDFPKERMYQKTLASIYKYVYNGLLEDLLNYQEASLTFMEPAFIEVLDNAIDGIKEAIAPLEEYTKDLSGE